MQASHVLHTCRKHTVLVLNRVSTLHDEYPPVVAGGNGADVLQLSDNSCPCGARADQFTVGLKLNRPVRYTSIVKTCGRVDYGI